MPAASRPLAWAATKVEELVPIIMPNSLGRAKLATTAPPAIAMGNMAKNLVTEVNIMCVRGGYAFVKYLSQRYIRCSSNPLAHAVAHNHLII